MLVTARSPEDVANMYHETEIVRVQRLENETVLNLLPIVIGGITEDGE
jgi:hypothetical protein